MDASKPWHPQPKEPAKAYEMLGSYLDMGPSRSLAALRESVQQLTKPGPNGEPPARARGIALSTLKAWSAKWDWRERAGAYDADHQLEEMKGRHRTRERVRQRFYDRAVDAAVVILDLMDGTAPEGDLDIVYDKHQNEVGKRLRVAPSVRAAQAQHVLAMAGLIVPKRVELEGNEGDELRMQSRQVLGGLPPEVARALLEALVKVDNEPDQGVPPADETAA